MSDSKGKKSLSEDKKKGDYENLMREVKPASFDINERSNKQRSRVRRRKRRSYQPIYRIRELRKVRLQKRIHLAIFLLIPVLLLLVYLYYSIVIRVQSNQFAKDLSSKISHRCGVDVDFKPLVINFRNFSTKLLTISPMGKSSNSYFKKAKFYNLFTSLKPKNFFNKNWVLTNINVKSVDLHFGERNFYQLENKKQSYLSAVDFVSAGLGLSFEPENISFKTFRFSNASLFWQNILFVSEMILRTEFNNSEKFVIINKKFNKNILINKLICSTGIVILKNFPKMYAYPNFKIKDVAFLYQNPSIQIERGEFESKNLTEGTFSGIFNFNNNPNLSVKLNFTKFDLKEWLQNDLLEYISGYLVGTTDIKYEFTNKKKQINAIFNDGKIKILKLPLFIELKKFSGLSGLDNFELSRINANVQVFDKSVKISNLQAIRQNLIKLTGQLEIFDKGKIIGDLEIGFYKEALNASLPKFQTIVETLTQKKDGKLYWLPLKISGSIHELDHNFHQIMKKAQKLIDFENISPQQIEIQKEKLKYLD